LRPRNESPRRRCRAAVTDDLISPKYDDDDGCNDESTDDGDDEDEESDDTVYECPGSNFLGPEGRILFVKLALYDTCVML
jgi:hypothetical protein